MSPDGQNRGKRVTPPDNIYTIILAVAFCVALVAVIVVAYRCYSQYGTIFSIP
jgi:hypothetical protein